MSKGYIPRAGAEFYQFQKNMVAKVSANAGAWGIPTAAANAFAAASVAYETAYHTSVNPLTRTKIANQEHASQRKSFEKQLRLFVNAWLLNNSAISLSDKVSMGLPSPAPKRHRRSAILVQPEIVIKNRVGGRIQLACRLPETEGKAHLHPEADGIEVFYSLEHPAPNPLVGTERFLSKKAYFTIDVGLAHAGKLIYLYARYINLQDMSKSGPISNYHMSMVAM
jgi:hypothetical protein